MKTLHYHWNRSLNWILTTLLGFLGFSSCEEDNSGNDNIICMYGTPTASYTIKGKVTNQAGQALSDIQIIVSDMEFSYQSRPDFIPDTPYGSYPVNDTLYTGKEGEFETRQTAFPKDTVKYNLKVNLNGNNPHYQADSLKVTFLRKDLQEGEGWNIGNATQEVKITLSPIKKENHE